MRTGVKDLVTRAAGGQRLKELQNIKEKFAMGSQQRQEKGQVIVARIGQIGFALLQDVVGILTDQSADRSELLLCRLALLPATSELAQHGDQGIGLFLVFTPIGIERLFRLVMHLL